MSLLSRLAVQAARAYGILSSNPNNVSADYLVVAGGGGGGVGNGGGGGGAGGLLTSTATLSTLNTYSITVGAGGAGGTTVTGIGVNGGNSVLSGSGLTTITSIGGGAGGTGINGANGGSGGGTNNGYSGGTGTSGQGNNGGTGNLSPYNIGGGGGGASVAGGNASASVSGTGGNGTASSISGSSVTYAGGGSGGSDGRSSATIGAAGTGGGGAGSISGVGTAGTANTGGGGGGGGRNGSLSPAEQNGGQGGSGIVIISYTSATPKFVGGTITTSGGKQIHTFTSSGTLSPITPITASYLVVAGGGGGGGGRGGGGGGGGLQTSSTTLYSGATYVVTVGAGGNGGVGYNGTPSNGSNSVISGTGLTTLTSVGGGYGANQAASATGTNGANGGSGGGGVTDSVSGTSFGTGGTATSGQGNNGGTSAGASNYPGGGGGGAGAVGSNATSTTGGNGGNGTASSISGSSVTYAGGGGGGTYNGGTAGSGGTGGGGAAGAGSTSTVNNGTAGTPNLGGGGGAGNQPISGYGNGGNGGSGIVIISYAGSQVFNGGLVTSSGGNTIHTFTSTGALTPLTNNLNNSLRFRSSASAYLSRTPTVAGNQQKWTYSLWLKRGTLSTVQNLLVVGTNVTGQQSTQFGLNNDNTIQFFDGLAGVSTSIIFDTTQVFRDPSAWYHIVLAVDTTQATSSNRVKMYVNGNQITAFTSSTYPTQNFNTLINAASIHYIGRFSNVSTNYFDGYLADVNLIDGQQLEPYYFGNNDANQVWKPIQYKGTYGTNGFYLTFGNTTSTTTLGYDSSPNGNNWTCNNISLTAGTTYDAMLDVPTNTSATVANYAVLNPTIANTTNLINANLTRNGAVRTNVASMVCTNGKYYFETTIQDSNGNGGVGVKQTTAYPLEGADTTKGATYFANGEYKIEGGAQTSGFSTYTNGDVIGIAIDTTLSTPKIWFAKNNTWQGTGDPTTAGYSLTSGLDYYFAILHTSSASSTTASANFGQRAFSYTPPTGYVALNTYNLPTPTILQGNKYMDATLYTGTGVSNTVVNQGQFKPDLVWMKARNAAQWNLLFDSVRGVGKWLTSNNTTAEVTDATSLTTFNSNGFAVSTDPAVSADTGWNASGNTMVGWQWQAGQGSTSSNTSGSITSTVSVNTTAGFSVVTYTGTGANATVGHGLGVAPKMIIFKGRSTTFDWMVYHTSLGNTNYLRLSATNASAASISAFNNTSPTSTVFSLGDGSLGNQASATQVAYCWAEIAGFSKISSYTGNGSSDGPFVFTNFRPKYILVKSTGIASWFVIDTARLGYNSTNNYLLPNASTAETTYNGVDILSNGFKVRNTDSGYNDSGVTYIYAAFAEHPAKISNAR